MIELFDEKLGVIKVLNVTDVRAHFAAVLSDDDCNYIITKNNRPQRVMISYTDFEKLKEYLQQDDSVPVKDPEQSLEKASKTPIRKEPIRGMLASQIELAQTAPEKKAKKAPVRVSAERPVFQKAIVNAPPALPQIQMPQVPVRQSLSSQVEREAKLTSQIRQQEIGTHAQVPMTRTSATYQPIKAKSSFIPRPEPPAIAPEKIERPRAPLPRYDAEDDYFKSSASIEDDVQIEFLPEPEMLAPEMTQYEEPEYSEAPEIEADEQEHAKEYDAVWGMNEDIAIKQDEDEKPLVRQKNKKEIEETQDPEKDAYFSKYRKLYEPYYDSGDVTGPAASFPPPPERKLPPQMPPVARPAAPKPQTQEPVYQSLRPSVPPPVYREAPTPLPPAPKTKPVMEEKKSTALPSLQELLKELEQEKLSGDEEQMKESDIDDLILRITHD